MDDTQTAPVRSPEPAAEPPTKPKTRKPATPEGAKTVTAASDLRVVTKDLVVVRLQAGKPRNLPNHLVHAAQTCAGEKGVDLRVD